MPISWGRQFLLSKFIYVVLVNRISSKFIYFSGKINCVEKMLRLVWLALLLTSAIASGQETNKKVSEKQLESLLAEYNSNLIAYCKRVQQTSWDVATDVGKKDKENANVSVNFIG